MSYKVAMWQLFSVFVPHSLSGGCWDDETLKAFTYFVPKLKIRRKIVWVKIPLLNYRTHISFISLFWDHMGDSTVNNNVSLFSLSLDDSCSSVESLVMLVALLSDCPLVIGLSIRYKKTLILLCKAQMQSCMSAFKPFTHNMVITHYRTKAFLCETRITLKTGAALFLNNCVNLYA